jgi:DNA-binding GntR family transcriptional regulator
MEYAYVTLANAIAAEIKSGKIPTGGKLPGELELADTHGVSAGTVRRAMQELRARGLVETLPHLGTYVKDPKGK